MSLRLERGWGRVGILAFSARQWRADWPRHRDFAAECSRVATSEHLLVVRGTWEAVLVGGLYLPNAVCILFDA